MVLVLLAGIGNTPSTSGVCPALLMASASTVTCLICSSILPRFSRKYAVAIGLGAGHGNGTVAAPGTVGGSVYDTVAAASAGGLSFTAFSRAFLILEVHLEL